MAIIHTLQTRRIMIITLMVISFVLVYACANVVSPTGGPIDEDPPKVTRSTPPNFSTNFDNNEIRIFFDEFIQLHNIRQQLLVSPPLDKTPEVRVRGRSIILEIDEALRPSSTYNIFFGDAIRDITEGNAIPNFQFVFSTGDYVDSLSVRGQVKNAFLHEPEEGVFVMLYDNVYDSVPYLERPVYLAKTDKEGQFHISNMADGEYLMFALRDNNANFKYDLPDEMIAFLDSLIRPEYVKPAQPVKEDEVEIEVEIEIEEADSDNMEMIPDDHEDPEKEDVGNFYTLYMFQEKDTVQRVVSSLIIKKGLLQIAFRIPFDSAYVRNIREPVETPEFIHEFSSNQDTLKVWFADWDRDSLFVEVLDRDNLLDTVARSAQPRARRDRQEADTVPPPLNISMNYRRSTTVPFFEPLGVNSEHPLVQVETDYIELMAHDSIPVPVRHAFKDHVKRVVLFDPMPEEGTPYTITIYPGAFTDIFGLKNDTLRARFTTTTVENYGNLIVNLTLPREEEQFILQILDDQKVVLQQKEVTQNDQYVFRNLMPDTYRLRLIHDKNRNGEWDTGNYLRGIQPEPVYFFPETVQIRENWDVEIFFD